jgi:hypothetical protein
LLTNLKHHRLLPPEPLVLDASLGNSKANLS